MFRRRPARSVVRSRREWRVRRRVLATPQPLPHGSVCVSGRVRSAPATSNIPPLCPNESPETRGRGNVPPQSRPPRGIGKSHRLVRIWPTTPTRPGSSAGPRALGPAPPTGAIRRIRPGEQSSAPRVDASEPIGQMFPEPGLSDVPPRWRPAVSLRHKAPGG